MTRVLVADDSETILLLLRKRLELAGYDVTTACDGVEALEALAAAPDGARPEVLLIDAMMPRKSGLEVLRELRSGGDQTPVLIVSAHRGAEELRDAERLGANGSVPKPIDWDDLLAKIERLASQSLEP